MSPGVVLALLDHHDAVHDLLDLGGRLRLQIDNESPLVIVESFEELFLPLSDSQGAIIDDVMMIVTFFIILILVHIIFGFWCRVCSHASIRRNSSFRISIGFLCIRKIVNWINECRNSKGHGGLDKVCFLLAVLSGYIYERPRQNILPQTWLHVVTSLFPFHDCAF